MVSVVGIFAKQSEPNWWVGESLSDYGLMVNDKKGSSSWGFYHKSGRMQRYLVCGRLPKEGGIAKLGGIYSISFPAPFQRAKVRSLNSALEKFCVKARGCGFQVFKLSLVGEDGPKRASLDLVNLGEGALGRVNKSSFQGLALRPKSEDESGGIHVIPFIGDLSGADLSPVTKGKLRKRKPDTALQLKESSGKSILRGWLKRSFTCPHCNKEVWAISFPEYPVFYGVAPKLAHQRQVDLRLILSLKWERQLWEKIRVEDGGSFRWEKKNGEFVPGKFFGLCGFCQKAVLLSFRPIQKRPEFAFSRFN